LNSRFLTDEPGQMNQDRWTDRWRAKGKSLLVQTLKST